MTKRRAPAKKRPKTALLHAVPSDRLSFLRAQVAAARAEGWEVLHDVGWIVPLMRRTSHLGTVIRNDPARLDPWQQGRRIAELLGWREQYLLDFRSGFVGRPMETSGLVAHSEEAWEMGRAFRAEVDLKRDDG